MRGFDKRVFFKTRIRRCFQGQIRNPDCAGKDLLRRIVKPAGPILHRNNYYNVIPKVISQIFEFNIQRTCIFVVNSITNTHKLRAFYHRFQLR